MQQNLLDIPKQGDRERLQLPRYLRNFWLVMWHPWEAHSFGITNHS